MGKWYLAVPVPGRAIPFLLLAGVVAFLVLFGSGHQAEAVTYKSTLTSAVGCAGLDGKTGTPADDVDNSCSPGEEHNPGVTADVSTVFGIPTANPMHSNYNKVVTFGMPVSWWAALDSDLGNGAYVGTIVARATLSLLNQPCTVPYNLTLTIPLFDCSTDITNTIVWAGDGTNLIADASPANGLPDGCDKYPTHALLDPDGTGPKPPLQPRARGFGYTNATPDATPTQINFVLYNPGQLSLMPKPEGDMGDSLGYGTYVVLDNPTIGEAAPSAITEFCTPLDTTSTMLGVTAGEGKAIAKAGAQPEFTTMCTGANVGVDNDGDTVVDDGCFVVTDKCRDSIDNDGDTQVDELCDLVRSINPTVLGIYGTGTHLADTYSDGNRDYDGDGQANSNDGCPCNDAGGDGAPDPDGDNDGIPNVCDPTPGADTGGGDHDGDGFQNRQDNCPLHPNGGALHIDTDGDGIGDACEGTNNPANWNCGATSASVANGPYSNDMAISGICIGEADSDGDGWCDSTETLLGSATNDPLKTPEYKGIDYKVVAAQTPPGQAPQSCTNLSVYSTGAGAGTAVDDDGDTLTNAADPGCATMVYDPTKSEDGAGPNTCSDGIDNGADTVKDAFDSDCVVSDKDQDGVVDASDNCAGTAPGKDANPAQLNTDATGTWAGDGDATGDACDSDPDADAADNKAEWGHGTDPKSPHGVVAFDFNGDAAVNILDVLLYKPKLSPAPYDYRYDMNLDGSVNILDVLLFKPALGHVEVDKYVSDVQVTGPGIVQTGPQQYNLTLPVGPPQEFIVRSVENNRAPTTPASGGTVPAGKAVMSFHCDVSVGMSCVWVKGGAPLEILTMRDRFANFRDRLGRWLSAVMVQVWGPLAPELALQPGDGLRWIAESSLHFLSTVSEPKNTVVNIDRNVQLQCAAPGLYTAYLCNKAVPRWPYTDYKRWDNEMCATVNVMCQ